MLRHPALRFTVSFVALPFALAFAPVPAVHAAPAAAPKQASKGKPKAPAPPKSDLDALAKQLAGDEASIVAALQSIAQAADPATAPLVADLLGRGGSQTVMEEALKTAGKLKEPSLSVAIAPYVRHRTPEIRQAAVRTLLKTKGPAAVDALKQGLSSVDAVVRGTSATGLGALGAKDALPALFTAFDHGVADAAAAIGQLCAPAECEKFAERTGTVAFDIMASGFDQILFRPPESIPDDAKLKLVGRMRELGTEEVGKYLADVGERWPKEWSKKVKQAIDSAARAVGGGGKKE
jgi:HEAT repeat protein